MSTLKALRIKAGLTQAGLANAIGVKRSTYSMWESGYSNPPIKLLRSMAHVLGCTVDDLIVDSKTR